MFSFYRLVEALERVDEDWKSKVKTGAAVAGLGAGLGVMAHGYYSLYKHRKFKEICEKTKCKKYKDQYESVKGGQNMSGTPAYYIPFEKYQDCIKDCVKNLELRSKAKNRKE